MGIENLDVRKSKTRLLKTPAWKALLEEAAADMDGDGAAEPNILRACLLSGRQRRLVLYHKMYTFIFGYINKAKRKKRPECIRATA